MPRFHTRPWRGEKVKVRFYQWPAKTCAVCPRQDQCMAPRRDEDIQARPRGRSISEHPEEQLLAQARAQQQTPEFRDAYRQRQTVEHRLARMMQLGARQARYFGRAKTELQWLIAATVANLTLALSQGETQKGVRPIVVPNGHCPFSVGHYIRSLLDLFSFSFVTHMSRQVIPLPC